LTSGGLGKREELEENGRDREKNGKRPHLETTATKEIGPEKGGKSYSGAGETIWVRVKGGRCV